MRMNQFCICRYTFDNNIVISKSFHSQGQITLVLLYYNISQQLRDIYHANLHLKYIKKNVYVQWKDLLDWKISTFTILK